MSFKFTAAAMLGAFLLAAPPLAQSAEQPIGSGLKPEDALLDEIANHLRGMNPHSGGSNRADEKQQQRPRFAYYPHEPQFRRRYFNHFRQKLFNGGSMASKEERLPLAKSSESSSEKSILPVAAFPVDHSLGYEGNVKRGPVRETSNTPIVIAGVISIALGSVIIGFAVYINRWTSRVKRLSEEADYPAYGLTGPGKTGDLQGSSLKKSASVPWLKPTKLLFQGDKRLAHSAHMFHFLHQKQQVIAAEQSLRRDSKPGNCSDSEDENEEGDYTVYECPGLATTGEMEVKNPLYLDEVTPALQSFP